MDDKLSIIISTKDREEDLLNCIGSILRQSVQIELIVVDDGNVKRDKDDLNLSIKELISKTNIKYLYLKTDKPGLTRSRNMGIANASAEFIMFLDDDVILEDSYVKSIMEVFEKDNNGDIGGVGGVITNYETHRVPFRYKLRNTVERMFLMSSKEQGKILLSGFDVRVRTITCLRKVEFLSGCNMTFRREVFDRHLFDEYFEGYGYGEDTDFCYRVSREYDLVMTPNARLEHHQSTKARLNTRELTRMKIRNRSYFFSNNIPQSAINRLCFLWAMFGLFCMTLSRFCLKPTKEGVQEILGWIDAFKYTEGKRRNPKTKHGNAPDC